MPDAKQRGDDAAQAQWRANVRLPMMLLVGWLSVSFAFAIVLAPWLHLIHLGGVPLGFGFAQQGSIYSPLAAGPRLAQTSGHG